MVFQNVMTLTWWQIGEKRWRRIWTNSPATPIWLIKLPFSSKTPIVRPGYSVNTLCTSQPNIKIPLNRYNFYTNQLLLEFWACCIGIVIPPLPNFYYRILELRKFADVFWLLISERKLENWNREFPFSTRIWSWGRTGEWFSSRYFWIKSNPNLKFN